MLVIIQIILEFFSDQITIQVLILCIDSIVRPDLKDYEQQNSIN